jgi:hypothetical protein
MVSTLNTFLAFLAFIMMQSKAFSSTSEDYIEQSFQSNVHVVGVYLFEGDRHKDFKNDLVTVLSDGSQWKIHPTQTTKFGSWQPGDSVQIGVRTSFYWFKREHKFYLKNLDKDKTVKAMLISYGDIPLQIVNTSNTYPTSTYKKPIYYIHNYYDSNGHLITNYILVGYKTVPCNYVKEIYLNNGRICRITKQFKHFTIGKYVYAGYNQSEDQVNTLLITGTQREAVWSWTSLIRN